jgi:hypothetical protein
MAGSDEDRGRSRRPGAEEQGWSDTGWVLGSQTIKCRVMLCAVCTMYMETRSTGFLVEPQNKGRQFVSGLASKLLGWFVSGLSLKPLGQFVSGLSSKPVGRFSPL